MQLKQFLLVFLLILSGSLFSQEPAIPEPGEVPSELEKKINGLVDQIKNNPNLQAGSIPADSMPSLPIGIVKPIGSNVYCIAIDSAFFKQDKAYFSAYTSIDFPGAKNNRKLAFAAKDINFNPSGILFNQGLKLQLVSDVLIHLGPNTDLFLPGDGDNNYVEFDCDGYRQVHLHGEFRFKGEMLTPTTPNAQYVTATFDVTMQDISNLYATVNMSPFEIKGMEGYIISVSEATVDWSDFQNPEYALPTSYVTQMNADVAAINAENTQNNAQANPLLWRGFYLKNVTVTLPPKFNKSEEAAPGTSAVTAPTGGTGSSIVDTTSPPPPTDGTPTTFYASNIFIDNSGVTGTFGATNVLGTGTGPKGNVGKWPLTITAISIGLQSNNLVMGSFGGEITLPFMDNNSLKYEATITQTPEIITPTETIPETVHYQFVLGLTNNDTLSLSKLKTALIIHNTSTLTVTVDNVSKKFVPVLNLDGVLSINHGSTASFANIGFQNVIVDNKKPFISGGQYTLTGQLTIANFSVALLSFKLLKDTVKNEVYFKTRFRMAFGEDEEANSATTFSVTCGFVVVAKYEYPGTDDKHLKYDRFVVNDIIIDVNTTAFKLYGVLIFKENDPVYGKLFYGEISLTIKKCMDEPITVRVGFGKTRNVAEIPAFGDTPVVPAVPSYKYWYTYLQVPVNIPIAEVITITSLIGGASYHVRQTLSDVELIAKSVEIDSTTAELNPPFVPDKTYGLGVKLGTGYKLSADESLLNGNIILGVQFNETGGVLEIRYDGPTYSLVKVSERHDPTVQNRIFSRMHASYNFPAKTFQFQDSSDIRFANCITGGTNMKVYYSPTDKYFWFNRPTSRRNLSLMHNGSELFSASTYFQCGNVIDPLGPLPTWAESIPGITASRTDYSASTDPNLSTGKGFAIGMHLNASVGGTEKEIVSILGNTVKGYATFGFTARIGFDLMMLKYTENAVCSQTGGKFGMNQRYCTGNMYLFAEAICGGRVTAPLGVNNSFTLFQATLKAIVVGNFPKPTYVYGYASASLEFLDYITISHEFDFDFGSQCTIVGG